MSRPLHKRIYHNTVKPLLGLITLRPLRKYIKNKKEYKESQKQINNVINLLKEESKKTKKPVVVYVSHFDYYSPLQQRPNHMFNIFADRGYPCLFCGWMDKYTNPRKNMHIIPYAWLKHILHGDFPKVFDVPYGYPYLDMPNFFQYINDKSLVIYELIDDFDLLMDSKIIDQAKDMFKRLVERENTFVFASANKLYDIALKLGAPKSRVFINQNAVNISDFQKENKQTPEIMQKILKKKKPIIGYYGALTASWFDFDLVKKLVEKNPQYEFVLMGLKYPDKNLDETEKYFTDLSKFDNFTYIPPVKYKEIPSYAKCWDVATIPFQINDITLGCSPVKLFEYMAMGLPIVTTPMPECKLYKSVFIAKNATEFEKQIAAALKAKTDKKYQKILAKEASENTWEARVDDMVKIIEKYYKE